MSLLARLSPLRDAHRALISSGQDPFSVEFSRVLSATEAIVQGRRTILLGTNNYLGLTFDPSCIEHGIAALAQQGTGTTGSRVANGSYLGHRHLERRLAAFFGRRHAIVFSTGYQANLGVISTLVGPGDHLVLDTDSHASIYDGSLLGRAKVTRFRHGSPEDLDRRLRRIAAEGGNKLIVVEGIYSMLGDTAPLREIVAVKREHGAYLLVDEAHSLGVLGENGRGLAEAAGVEADVDFIVGTFSKSLGSVGGFCVSDHPDFEVLRIACRPYMFTASLPPSVIATTVQALRRIEEAPELRATLRANARALYDGLAAAGFVLGPEPNPIVAVKLPSSETAVAFWNALLQNGVYLNLALPPATPDHCALLRASVSAAHSAEQIAHVVRVFSKIGHEMGLLKAPGSKEPLANAAG
ncbi:MAG: aminotransferase class I/II-fold pyridoxal phosphate-dependent enzyme [Rhodospirillales bacterium]|nr:aminotransferase class I/II-fold pyridoxal phosphate-dependent enzyme [Rhodospirillales bacterium]